MAAMVRLLKQVGEIVEDSYNLKNLAEENRNLEFLASLRVQAWYRGTRCRSYLRYLNKCATNIQKAWRGFLGRQYYRILVKNSVFIMKLNYYNEMASKIQKVWRGYYVRKYISNYYSRKRYLEALQVKNEIFRTELTEFAEHQSQIQQRIAEQAYRKEQEQAAIRTHYLISTHVIPGIYNSPFQPFPADQEYLLRSVKPVIKRKKKTKDTMFDPAWISYNLPRPETLPPLSDKPQGPFRDPQDVQDQRYKPFQPTLRVSTSFLSLEKARQEMKDEEWVTRLIDDRFIPFSKRERPYEPLLYSTSRYGHLPYGTKYFREENLDQHITQSSFKTLVPPIPIFSKLNDTYSQGQV